jgi:hypothetical protein
MPPSYFCAAFLHVLIMLGPPKNSLALQQAKPPTCTRQKCRTLRRQAQAANQGLGYSQISQPAQMRRGIFLLFEEQREISFAGPIIGRVEPTAKSS